MAAVSACSPSRSIGAQFRVPYRSGENVLELHSRSDDGRELRDVLKIDFRMQPYDFRSGRMPFEEIAVNCGSPCFFNDATKNDYLWLPDQPYREGSWGYVGGPPSIVGTASALVAIIISWVRRSIRCTRPSWRA